MGHGDREARRDRDEQQFRRLRTAVGTPDRLRLIDGDDEIAGRDIAAQAAAPLALHGALSGHGASVLVSVRMVMIVIVIVAMRTAG